MDIDDELSPSLGTNARVEDVPDESEITRLIERYPHKVAEILQKGETCFEQWERDRKEKQESEWAPFANEADWELAFWLVTNIGHNQIEEFLKLSLEFCAK